MAYVAENGGFVGLFLGYSVLQMADIYPYLVQKINKIWTNIKCLTLKGPSWTTRTCAKFNQELSNTFISLTISGTVGHGTTGRGGGLDGGGISAQWVQQRLVLPVLRESEMKKVKHTFQDNSIVQTYHNNVPSWFLGLHLQCLSGKNDIGELHALGSSYFSDSATVRSGRKGSQSILNIELY